jgi:hypothetical protein
MLTPRRHECPRLYRDGGTECDAVDTELELESVFATREVRNFVNTLIEHRLSIGPIGR